MKIYDMIEGVWLKDEKKKEKEKKEKRKELKLLPRLVTHEEKILDIRPDI